MSYTGLGTEAISVSLPQRFKFFWKENTHTRTHTHSNAFPPPLPNITLTLQDSSCMSPFSFELLP